MSLLRTTSKSVVIWAISCVLNIDTSTLEGGFTFPVSLSYLNYHISRNQLTDNTDLQTSTMTLSTSSVRTTAGLAASGGLIIGAANALIQWCNISTPGTTAIQSIKASHIGIEGTLYLSALNGLQASQYSQVSLPPAFSHVRCTSAVA